MANIIKLGSLHLDGQPIKMGADYAPGQSIEVGETISGKEISWVVVNGMLIADQCLLTNVSWDDLNAQNLVFGKKITIGGFLFTVRLLQVGAEKGVPNEWDAALDEVGENDDIWHWKDSWFWGQESMRASRRARRGYRSARYWNWSDSSYRIANLGFRPALVPLLSDTLSDTRNGETLMLWDSQNIAFGRLEELTDYEVVLSGGDGSLSDGFGSRLSDGRIVIDRGAIAGVQTRRR